MLSEYIIDIEHENATIMLLSLEKVMIKKKQIKSVLRFIVNLLSRKSLRIYASSIFIQDQYSTPVWLLLLAFSSISFQGSEMVRW